MEWLFIVILATLYFLPWIIAALREHQNSTSIGILNFFLGWTFIGWVAALIWAASRITKAPPVAKSPPANTSLADELQKLADLRDKGILTQAEFEAKKTAMLDRS